MLDFLSTLGQHNWLVKPLGVVVLLGVLIFVHELGHFLFAKLFGVGVEKFSFGFGPRITGFVWHGTEYRLSWIPLGGYVKMVGDDPFEEDEPKDAEGSFLSKPIWQRLAVVLAGPMFNLMLPIALFSGVYMIGAPEPLAWVGRFTEESAARDAGIEIGDRIVSVGGRDVHFFEDLRQAVLALPLGARTDIVVEREGVEHTFELSLRVQKMLNRYNKLADQNMLGVGPASDEAVVGVVSSSESPAHVAGLRAGDKITSLDGEPIRWWYQVARGLAEAGSKEVSIEAIRDGENVSIEVIVPRDHVVASDPKAGRTVVASSLTAVHPGAMHGIFPYAVFVRNVREEMPARAAGLEAQDMILSINDTTVGRARDIRNLIDSSAGSKVDLVAVREGQLKRFDIAPRATTHTGPSGETETSYVVGLLLGQQMSTYQDTLRLEPFAALVRGGKETVDLCYASAVLLGRVIVGDIPLTESIGGPITIASVAAQSAATSIFTFLQVMALISVSLGLINLLPIPLLDGGHILFFSLELVRGRPVSMRFREISQQVGMIILFVLMVFALANDVRMNFFR